MFSPIVRHASIRVLLTLIVIQDLEPEQLYVKMVFLHSELEEQIYMKQQKGFAILNKEVHVCLVKNFYMG